MGRGLHRNRTLFEEQNRALLPREDRKRGRQTTSERGARKTGAPGISLAESYRCAKARGAAAGHSARLGARTAYVAGDSFLISQAALSPARQAASTSESNDGDGVDASPGQPTWPRRSIARLSVG